MSNSQPKPISLIEHFIHIGLSLITNGIWLAIYIPRFVIKQRALDKEPKKLDINQEVAVLPEVKQSSLKSKKTIGNIVFAVIVGLAAVGYLINQNTMDQENDSYWCESNPSIPAFSKDCGKSTQTEEVTQAVPDTSWVPSNFNVWSEDFNVAYRWLEGNEFECDYGDSCWGMMIITKVGCPNSLYAELSILDKNDVQISYTNDSLSSALPLQKSKMVFRTYEVAAETARIAKISCY